VLGIVVSSHEAKKDDDDEVAMPAKLVERIHTGTNAAHPHRLRRWILAASASGSLLPVSSSSSGRWQDGGGPWGASSPRGGARHRTRKGGRNEGRGCQDPSTTVAPSPRAVRIPGRPSEE
jgi:hypothetical protein